MIDVADELAKVNAKLDTLISAVQTPPTVTVDLTPALDAVAGVKADVAAFKTEFEASLTPTPPQG